MKPADKIKSLSAYAQGIKNRLESPVPAKHVNRPEAYRAFLKSDLEKTERAIERLRAV